MLTKKSDLCVLLEEQKRLKDFENYLEKKQEIEEKLSKLETEFTKWFTNFEKNWKNWHTKDVCQWIKIVDSHKYEKNCEQIF